jgi:hypothetical protein
LHNGRSLTFENARYVRPAMREVAVAATSFTAVP